MWKFLRNLFKREVKPSTTIIPSCVYDCPRSDKCPKWVILETTIGLDNGTTEKQLIGRCADAWLVYMIVELKDALKAR